MLSGYIRLREIVQATELFDAMPVRDPVSWNVMIFWYVVFMGGGHVEEARRLFYGMPERDGFLEHYDKWIYFLQNGDIKSALKMFERIPTRDSASVSGSTSGLIQNGKLDDAADILLTIEKTDRDVDVLDAYNTLIAGYGQRGRVYEARRLFDQIHAPLYQDKEEDSSSCSFERSIISWNSMIMCYAKAGDMNSSRAQVTSQLVLLMWNIEELKHVQANSLLIQFSEIGLMEQDFCNLYIALCNFCLKSLKVEGRHLMVQTSDSDDGVDALNC
ncbi:hypothetical protein ACLOJK_038354 [Asimina triloba]